MHVQDVHKIFLLVKNTLGHMLLFIYNWCWPTAAVILITVLGLKELKMNTILSGI